MRICTLNGKNQTQELSAVKMLAILSKFLINISLQGKSLNKMGHL